MLRSVLFFAVTLLLSSAHAGYFTSVKNSPGLDYSRRTRILVAGRGAELSTLFQSAAAAKSLKLMELYPQDQIVFFAYNELGEQKNLAKLRTWGFQVIGLNNNLFTKERLINELSKFRKIASLELFTHTSAIAGSQLEGQAYRISQDDDISHLRANFTADSFIYLHGCNSGFNLAPAWSSMLGVPVAGSLTYTGFQKLHTNGEFYPNDDALKPEGDWSPVNALSFPTTKDCVGGGCLRMKPDNSPYTGGWGDYNDGGGLPFYKFFCVRNNEARCLTAMAESLFGLLGKKDFNFKSSYADYNQLVLEFLCPVSAKRPLRETCVRELQDAVTTGAKYNPFQGKLLTCNFKKCEFEIRCQQSAASCRLYNPLPSSNAVVEEYKTYLKAFSAFTASRM